MTKAEEAAAEAKVLVDAGCGFRDRSRRRAKGFFDEVIERFGGWPDRDVRGLVAMAYGYAAMMFDPNPYQARRTKTERRQAQHEARCRIAYLDALVKWADAPAEPDVRWWVSAAFVLKAEALMVVHRYAESTRAFDAALAFVTAEDELRTRANAARAAWMQGNVFHIARQPAKALAAFEKAEVRFGAEHAHEIRDCFFQVLAGKGRSLFLLGRHDDAVAAYAAAIAFARTRGRDRRDELSQAILGKADALVAAKRHREALALCNRAIPLCRRDGQDGLVCRAQELKAAALKGLGRLAEARRVIRAAKALAQRIETENQADDGSGDGSPSAIVTKAEAAAKAAQMAAAEAQALVEAGCGLAGLRRRRAKDFFNEVIERFSRWPDPSVQVHVARAYFHVAEMFDPQPHVARRTKPEWRTAQLYAKRRIAYLDALLKRAGASADGEVRMWVVRALLLKGETLSGMGRLAESVRAFGKTLAFGTEKDWTRTRVAAARAAWMQGLALRRAKQPAKALAALEKADAVFGPYWAPEIVRDRAMILYGKGRSLFLLGRHDEAVDVYDAVIDLEHTVGWDRSEDFLQAILGKAEALVAGRHFLEAVATCNRALLLSRSARFVSLRLRVYELKGAALKGLGKVAAARRVDDVAKALAAKQEEERRAAGRLPAPPSVA